MMKGDVDDDDDANSLSLLCRFMVLLFCSRSIQMKRSGTEGRKESQQEAVSVVINSTESSN